MRTFLSKRGPGVAEHLAAVSLVPIQLSRRDPAPVRDCRGAVVVAACVIGMLVVAQAIQTPNTAEGRILDVGVFGLPVPRSGEYFVTTVPTRAQSVTAADRDAMLASRRLAMDAARTCAGADAGVEPVRDLVTEVAGPSGGLMFALALIDHLDGGRDLARGRRAAGTGALGPGGTVRPVGAVASKARTAEAAGADLFLVPFSQMEEAERAVLRIEVIGVSSVEDAVLALSGRGCAES